MDREGADAIELLRRLKLQGENLGPVIVLSDPLNLDRIAQATSLGIDDFLQKPFSPEELENAIKEVSARPRRPWRRSPAEDVTGRLEQEMALWRSPRMREVRKIIEQAAHVDITVLITGETGTGKDLVARAIHQLSSRQSRPFVKVNCAAVPRELLESELFGHERGAFTGAHQLKIGKFEAADQGTIFLDEIGDLHPALQAKLLHVLQDGEFSRVGAKSTIKVDVRIIAATNQDLEKAVAAGRFREDLYYRLNVIEIVAPPLRERSQEIPLLASYFAHRYSKLYNRTGFTIPPQVMEQLIQHDYPGNIRELENIVKRMIVLDDPHLSRAPVPLPKPDGNGNGASDFQEAQAVSLKDIAREAAQAAERVVIAKMLDQTHWNRVKAAKLLNISYRALLYKIKNVGLERAEAGNRK
jgi:two-component system response regulator AtoC